MRLEFIGIVTSGHRLFILKMGLLVDVVKFRGLQAKETRIGLT